MLKRLVRPVKFFFFGVSVVAHIEGGFGCCHRGRSRARAAEFSLAALMRRTAPAASVTVYVLSTASLNGSEGRSGVIFCSVGRSSFVF